MKIKEKLGKSFAEYFDSTTIHGFSYLGRGHHTLERVTWLAVICFTLAGLLIYQSIEEANKNPVLTNVESIPLNSKVLCSEDTALS